MKFHVPLNMRKIFRELMEQVGFHWVALRSVDLTKKCSKCTDINSQYEDAPASCKLCMGTGYAYIDKLTKSYSYKGAFGLDEKTELGTFNTENLVYVFEHHDKPKTSDYILELVLDETTGEPTQPFRIRKIYKISDAQPMLGTDSRIEFWRCYTEEQNIDDGKSSV